VEYKRVMRGKIDQAIHSVTMLRAALRSRQACDLTSQSRDLLSQLQNVLLMFQCFELQASRAGAGEIVSVLHNLLGKFEVSGVVLCDNVRCMDDLQYELLPVLHTLRTFFPE